MFDFTALSLYGLKDVALISANPECMFGNLLVAVILIIVVGGIADLVSRRKSSSVPRVVGILILIPIVIYFGSYILECMST